MDQLPAEITLRIVLHLSLPALARFQAVSSSCRAFVRAHEDLIYSLLAGYDISIQAGRISLPDLCDGLQNSTFGRSIWKGVNDWKEFCRRQTLLHRNRADPKAYLSRTYSNDSPARLTWRLKVDPKDRLLITTHRTLGLRVHDLDTKEQLWYLRRVGPYSHLEYDPEAGIAVFNLEDDLEIWKLLRCPVGTDPNEFQRGQFVFAGGIPAIEGMRGFHLKDGIIAIVSEAGTTTYYDLVTNPNPTHLRTLTHRQGAIGYLDKTPSTLVLCHDDLTRCYDPLTGSERGSFPPPNTLPLPHYRIQRPSKLEPPNVMTHAEVVFTGKIEPEDLIYPDMMEGKEWKACHVNGPYLVMLSDMSRLFVCTDYEAVLDAPEGQERDEVLAATCCYFEMDVELDEDEVDGVGRYTGHTNWLSVCDGRAAFGALDHILILTLPSTKSAIYPSPPHALALPTSRTVPISCLSLTPDALFTVWGSHHQQGLSWYRLSRNVVRVVWVNEREEAVTNVEREVAEWGKVVKFLDEENDEGEWTDED